MTNKDAVISLFSGAGGMSLGFAQAGVKPVFAADIDEDACSTYRENLQIDAIEADISEGSLAFLKKLDRFRGAFALIGGPPCQGFSSAGKKSGKDNRNRLIFEYISIVERIHPRWFVFENVEGILTSNGGASIRDLAREFIALGYHIRLEKVNFASYGLPQGRKRIVVIGNRLGLDFGFPSSTHSFNAGKHKCSNGLPSAPSFSEALAGLGCATNVWEESASYSLATPLNSYDRIMRHGNEWGKISHHVAAVPAQIAEAIRQLKPGETMKDLPSEYWHDSFKRRAFRRVMDGTPTERRGGAPSGIKRLVGNLNSLTITSAATREFIHPTENRPLTVRECARLQSFPDSFCFTGGALSKIRQIGNAFPPLAARVFAEHLMQLDGALGADTSSVRLRQGKLIAFRLTDAFGMSPALANTKALLQELSAHQTTMQFDLALGEVA
jgi:DNA (cytosine-5)-methyltransferase 1